MGDVADMNTTLLTFVVFHNGIYCCCGRRQAEDMRLHIIYVATAIPLPQMPLALTIANELNL